jgi:hypothetical protein
METLADPIRRVGDMWNETRGTWFELGMRFKDGEPYGEMFVRPRTNAVTEGRSTGKGIWQPIFVK